MHIFAQLGPSPGFATLVFFAIGACLVAWAAIIERLASGKPVLPYQPRRRVPWGFWDLLAVAFFYIVGLTITIILAQYFWPAEATSLSHKTADGQISTVHPIVQLLAMRNWVALFICSTSAVVVAPIAEEFFFRVLLQGWLEKAERSWRRRVPMLRRWLPLAAMPILISSLIFAEQHFRQAAPQLNVNYLVLILSCDSVARILSLILGIIYIHLRVGATAIDFGWKSEKILADVRLGLITFLAVAFPVYAILITVSQIVPEQYAPDPIPMFFFGIALGLLYNRTHRALPSIALHVTLNACSLAMFLLRIAK